MEIGKELLNVPMGKMIEEMAISIADAQVKLDENSIKVAEMMGGLKTIYDKDGNVTFEDSRIFFGKEKMLRSEAITLHNNTTDTSLKTEIAKKFDADNSNLEKITSGTDKGKYKVKASPTVAGDPVYTVPSRVSMLEIGFTPNFYQFVDTIIEVRIAISVTEENSSVEKVKSNSRSVDRSFGVTWGKGQIGINKNRTVTTTNVNATYSSKYNYSAEGSSLLRTKLTPIPPPPILEERIRRLMDIEFGAQ